MSSRLWKHRIDDMLTAIRRIENFTAGMKREDFMEDEKTSQAVMMNFTIIGEAVASLPPEVTQREPQIPWPLLKGMRNILVHGYFKVNLATVWDAVEVDLPELKVQLTDFLARANKEE